MILKRVLIVEDEPGICLTLGDRLTAEGYDVTIRNDGKLGESAARSGSFDIMLLDLMLPGEDGLTVCQNLRRDGISISILMLTARDTNLDVVIGLRQGADDYLTKPFDANVLLARMEALLRRPPSLTRDANLPGITRFGDFVLDRDRGTVTKKGAAIPLNAQEYRLLDYLASKPGCVLSRAELLDKVWGYKDLTSTRTIDVHIAKLRAHMGETDRPKHIRTLHGRGYKFEP
jgi:two-component system, OmpR family, alkaline phosphatase synthesis response regulator PhoP